MVHAPTVLLTGYEAAPFYKKGGLGDVMGALPTTLRKIGVDARFVMPFYHQVREQYPQKKIGTMHVRFGSENRTIVMYEGVFPGTKTPVYFLENRKYINLVKTKVEKLEQFVFFDLAVCYFINWLSQQNIWQVQLVHCNDWHTALIPLILEKKLQSSIPTLLTIHNLLYQGNGSSRVLELMHITDEETSTIKKGHPVTEMSILGEGIRHATMVSTVSPTYAKEILHNDKHAFISAYIKAREEDHGKHGQIKGILNGIDTSLWDPSKPVGDFVAYDLHTVEKRKPENKKRLLKTFDLPDRPTCSFIGRMAGQKGIELILEAMEQLSFLGCNVILLGEGDEWEEANVRDACKRYPQHLRAYIGYSEAVAHKLHAGSDFVLMPSHYEPCGLVQMVAMRYGTLPIASRTGGLIDTIVHNKTGYLFTNGSVAELVRTVKHALDVYRDQERHQRMVKEAMRQDFSWNRSAKVYRDLYIDMLKNN